MSRLRIFGVVSMTLCLSAMCSFAFADAQINDMLTSWLDGVQSDALSAIGAFAPYVLSVAMVVGGLILAAGLIQRLVKTLTQ